MTAHDVVITGIGLVSSLGVGVDAHWSALTATEPKPVIDSTRYAPYTVHPLPEIDWNQQIAKRGDQRQMETWQRLGTYTAGLALDDAGIKGDEALCASMDMIIAAGGGERDENVDSLILAASETRSDTGVLLNEKLTTELRPTLFLAQLSNLLAGNISIVHKVIGSSRTFMGEEGAGVSAVETAAARIRSGQSTHLLLGGAFQTEHHDMLLGQELGGYLHRAPWQPVWNRQGAEGGGLITGSGAAFLVLESRGHAEKRGRTPYAVVSKVASGNARRNKGDYAEAVTRLIGSLDRPAKESLLISAASGTHLPTAAEKVALDADATLAYRGLTSLTGHLKEAQFPFAVALAAMAIKNHAPYPAFASGEKAYSGQTDSVLATAVGYHRFEGAALLTAA
ncbi:MAG TPA: beta-ketoacyl-ACP synthase [Rhizobiaceae bacterium]|nr:beta-ketoacyl-ACP synthase [Rhizobiaceae bacterium]